MKSISKDFAKIRNNNSHFLAQVEKLKAQIASLDELTQSATGLDELLVANRADFVKSYMTKNVDMQPKI